MKKITFTIGRIIKLTFKQALILFLTLFVLYMTVFRAIDGAVCYSLVKNRLDISQEYSSIHQYIYNLLTPGINRNEAHSRIIKIGKFVVTESLPYISDSLVGVEDIQLRICSHPFNNIRLLIRYDEKDNILSIDIPEENGNFFQVFLPR